MIAAGTGATCPTCRLFSDLFAGITPADLHVRCPWCGTLATSERWAHAAELDGCAECAHPRAMHACYVTSDGEAPRPGGPPIRVEPAPCARCGCKATHGANEVRLR